MGSNLFTKVTDTLDVALNDNARLAYLAKCTGVPPTTAGIFNHGCMIIREDSGAAAKSVYENTGTTAAPVWNLMGDVAASELTLAQDNILVGGSTGVAEASAFPKFATTQALSGAGAVDVVTAITEVTTTGVDALTLADGVEGQVKFIVMVVDGGDGTLTPTNLAGGTTITFDAVGDSATLLFTAATWFVVGISGAVVA